MPLEISWKITFLLLFIIYSLVRIPYAIRNKKNKAIKNQSPLKEKLKVFIAFQGMLTIPLLYVFTPWLDSFAMNLPVWLRFTGFAVMFFGILFFAYIHKALDKNWSPVLEIKENHELITSGPYKYIRHPMYTQAWLWVLGQFLLISNWLVGIVGIITWSILYFTRIDNEEKMMIDQFGNKYKEYMQVTGRLIPKVF